MLRIQYLLASMLACNAASGAGSLSLGLSGQWPQFRGPHGDGHADTAEAPAVWSESNHIVWKSPVHGAGWSSPVILDKQLWLTTAQPDGKQLFAMCFDVDTGKALQDIKVFDVEKPVRLPVENTYASPTPLVEKGRVYVHYGTYGTACLETATGKMLWNRRDLTCDHQVGPGGSLAGSETALFFSHDGLDQQYVVALDKATGQTLWKTPRSTDFGAQTHDYRKAFSTPVLVDVEGKPEVVSVGSCAVMGYDAATGDELWKVRFKGYSVVPTPVFGSGIAYMSTGYGSPTALLAVRLNGRGDVTESHVNWKLTSRVSIIPSPLLVDDCIYMVNDAGVVSCVEAKSGKVLWDERITGDCYASPVYAGGRIYFCARSGATTVLAPGHELRVLGTNYLAGAFMASPAVAENSIFLRSKTDLYRIARLEH